MKSVKLIYLTVILLFCSFQTTYAQCYGNPQATGNACIGNTITLTSSGNGCTVCTYNWTQSSTNFTLVAGGGTTDAWAQYSFVHPYIDAFDF